MAKRTKKRTSHASSRMHRTPKVKTYPRLAILSVVLLTLVGLGYVWAYYNKINVRTPEIMRQASCKSEEKCWKECIKEFGKGTQATKDCRAACTAQNLCGTNNSGGGGVSYACSTEKTEECTIGKSEECKQSASGSYKFTCEPNPNGTPGKGCWVKSEYSDKGCQANTNNPQNDKKCNGTGPLGICSCCYVQEWCQDGWKSGKCFSDTGCTKEIDCNDLSDCQCKPAQYNTCIDVGRLCQNDCKVVNDSRCGQGCSSLKRCSAIGNNCGKSMGCDITAVCSIGYTRCMDDTGGNFTQKCCKP